MPAGVANVMNDDLSLQSRINIAIGAVVNATEYAVATGGSDKVTPLQAELLKAIMALNAARKIADEMSTYVHTKTPDTPPEGAG